MKAFSVSTRRLAAGLGLAVLLTQTAPAQAAGPAPEAQAQKPIDPQRYLGRWYEIARIPNSFQKNCLAATSDWARKDDGQFDVVQTCHVDSANGPAKSWRGAGRLLDPAQARIRIGFFGGFIQQDYVVVDRSDDYSWCILSTVKPKFIWIMSRRPVMDEALKANLTARARQLGLNVANLVFDDKLQPAG